MGKKHWFKDKYGKEHIIEEYGWDKTHAIICLNNYKIMNLKMYYRYERTWDDHLGNTPCGYYVNVPINHFNKKKEVKRVYLNLAM